MILNIYANSDGSLEASLPVFDGVEQSLANVMSGSNQINKAVFEGWTGQNVYKSIADGYWQMISRLTPEMLKSLDKSTNEQIVRSLGLKKGSTFGAADLKRIHRKLEGMAIVSEARKSTMKRMATQTDHMAGAKRPYARPGKTTESNSPLDFEGIKLTMNEIFNDELARLRAEMKAEQAPKASYAQAESQEMISMIKVLGQPVENHASVYRVKGSQLLPLINERDGATAEQTQVLWDVVSKQTAISEATYYFGDGKALEAVKADLHNDLDQSLIQLGQAHPSAGVVFIANQSPETLLHEVLHTHTLGVLESHFADPTNSPEHVQDAAKRLTFLVQEVLEMNPANVKEQASLEVLQEQLRELENKPAQQISELISYSLSNQDLIKLGQKTKVYSPLMQVIRKSLGYFKKMLGISGHPGDTLFSNIKFNTQVLLATPVDQSAAKQAAQTRTVMDQVFPSDQRISRIEALFVDRLDSFLAASRPKDPGLLNVNKGTFTIRLDDLEQVSTDAAEAAVNAGFEMNPRQALAFKAVHKAMMSGMKLDPTIMRQANEMFGHVVQTLKAEDFLRADGVTGTPSSTEMDQANSRRDFLLNIRKDPRLTTGGSDILATFVALAQVDDSLRTVLQEMKTPKINRVKWDSVDSSLEGLGTTAVNMLTTLSLTRDRQNPNVTVQLDLLSAGLMEVKTQSNFLAQLQVLEKPITWANDKAASAIKTGSEKATEWVEAQTANSSSPAVKTLGTVAAGITSLGSKELSAKRGEALTKMLNHAENWHEVRALVNDVRGATCQSAL